MKGKLQKAIVGIGLLTLIGCTPAPRPNNEVSTECQFAQNQTLTDLQMNCSVTGTPSNVLIDPFNPQNSSCGLTSFLLYDQMLTLPATFVWGENGDDGSARVRIGVIVGESTHAAHLAKSAGSSCESITGPIVNIATSFSGRHVALIDKGKVPMCVFQSRYKGTTFTQNGTGDLTGIGGDLSFATQSATENVIARRLDFEAARAVNRLLGLGSSLDAEFERYSGRCPNDYKIFEGD